MVKGSTDSEHIFALFIDKIAKIEEVGIAEIKDGLLAAMAEIEELKKMEGVTEPSTMNLVLANGTSMIATRYVSSGEESNSLYVADMGSYSCKDGLCQMSGGNSATLVVSEPLSDSNHWQRVKNNHLIMVDRGKPSSIHPIQLGE